MKMICPNCGENFKYNYPDISDGLVVQCENCDNKIHIALQHPEEHGNLLESATLRVAILESLRIDKQHMRNKLTSMGQMLSRAQRKIYKQRKVLKLTLNALDRARKGTIVPAIEGVIAYKKMLDITITEGIDRTVKHDLAESAKSKKENITEWDE